MKKKQEDTLKDKVVLITGGGSGMGGLAARNCGKCGASVAAIDINDAGLKETSKDFDTIKTWQADITNYDELETAVKEIESTLGPIDRVYNAAGIMPMGLLLEQEAETIHRLMAVNYGGLVNIAKLTVPGMIQRGKGEFIHFASMCGWLPTLLTGAYSATKFAGIAFMETLYHENLNKGVQFACICPPLVKTPLLQQAVDTVWPKMLDTQPPIEAQVVIDAIENGLDAGQFWVFPGKGTKMGYIMRRLFPGLIWKMVHKTEGF